MPTLPLDSFDETFQHQFARVKDMRLHYVIGGKGPPVLLLAGFPQSWYAWRRVMPLLAEHHQVIAIDLPGQSDSDKPPGGYDTKTLAGMIHGVMNKLEIANYFVAAHDVGAWVAYPYAALYGTEVRKLALIEAGIPGVTLRDEVQLGPNSWKSWHFLFNTIPDLPEGLIEGRERFYLNWFLRRKAADPLVFSERDISEYERVFISPGALRAGLAYYRAVPQDIADNKIFSETKLKMPILAYGAEFSLGNTMLEGVKKVGENVEGGTVPNCGHYVPEEAPEFLGQELIRFFALPETK
jgi:pimeloyl-ACP methyl ester carboxylesterase